MGKDTRLYTDTGKIRPYMRPIINRTPYKLHDIANSVLWNIKTNRPELNVIITDTPNGYIIELLDNPAPARQSKEVFDYRLKSISKPSYYRRHEDFSYPD